MLEELKFQHIGIAVNKIENTSSYYLQAGYSMTEPVIDPIQNIRISFLSKQGMPTIELLEPIDDKSPVCNILSKSGVTPYHLCYTTENLDDSILKLRRKRFVTLSHPVSAIAFQGKKICFLFNKDVGLIELVEE